MEQLNRLDKDEALRKKNRVQVALMAMMIVEAGENVDTNSEREWIAKHSKKFAELVETHPELIDGYDPSDPEFERNRFLSKIEERLK